MLVSLPFFPPSILKNIHTWLHPSLLQATIFIGFLQSGCQLLLQTTLLIRFWDNFNGVLIQYGTLLSPQCTSKLFTITIKNTARELLYFNYCTLSCTLQTASSSSRAFSLHSLWRNLPENVTFSARYPLTILNLSSRYLNFRILTDSFMSGSRISEPLPSSCYTLRESQIIRTWSWHVHFGAPTGAHGFNLSVTKWFLSLFHKVSPSL